MMIMRVTLSRMKLDASALIKLLAEDVIYEAQEVLTPLVGKAAVSNYLTGRFEHFREVQDQQDIGRFVHGSIDLPEAAKHPCIIVYDATNTALAVWVLKLNDKDQIKRIDILSKYPDPRTANPYGP